MNGSQALQAVLGPGAELVSEEVGRQIVRFVAGSPGRESTPGHVQTDADGPEGWGVEPSLLSLVCRELNDRRLSQGLPRITADLLAGSSERILQDFYERCVGDQPPAVREFIEEELLTDSGARENMALERARTKLRERGAPPSAVNELVKRRLLHLEERLGRQRVELTHDVLTEVVKKSRDKRQQQEAARRAERREQEVQRQLRQSRRRLAYMMGLAVFFAAVSGVALYYWQEANAARKEADKQTEIAQTAKREAVIGKDRAEKGEKEAKAAQTRLQDFEYELYAQSANNPAPLDIFAGFLEVDTRQLDHALEQNREDVGFLQRKAFNLALRADIAEKRKKPDEAQRLCEQALEAAWKLSAKNGDVASLQCAVRTCGMIVDTYRALGKLPEAIEASTDALKAYRPSLAEAAGDTDDPKLRGQIASIYFKIGNFLFDQGKLEDALDSFLKAQYLGGVVWGKNGGIEAGRNLALDFEKVGDVYKTLGRYEEARKAYENDLAVRVRLTREDPSKAPPELDYNIDKAWYDVSTAYQKIGSLELALGDPWDAEDAYRNSIRIGETLVQRDQLSVKFRQGLSYAWNGLGDAAQKQGQLALPVFGAGFVGLLSSRLGQGIFLPAPTPISQEKRMMQAEDYYKTGLKIIQEAAERGQENDDLQNDLAVGYGRLGDADLHLAKIQEAVGAYRRRVVIRRFLAEKTGSDEARHALAVDLGVLSYAEFLNFQFREANADWREALEIDPTLVSIRKDLAPSYLYDGN